MKAWVEYKNNSEVNLTTQIMYDEHNQFILN